MNATKFRSDIFTQNILIRFLKLAKKMGGIHPKKIYNIYPFILKGTIFYPISLLEHWLFSAQIKKHKLSKDPVFILGYYRNGTTHLQNILSFTDEFGTISQYDSIMPECCLLIKRPLVNLFQRISKILTHKNFYHKTQWDWDLVGEEDVALTSLALEQTCYWGFMFPQTRSTYFEKFGHFESITKEELQEWKDIYSTLILKFSYMNHGKQILLKTPPSLGKIKELHELYPHSKFLYIHRNPAYIIKSVYRLWEINNKINFGPILEKEEIEKIVVDDYIKSVKRFEKYKSSISNDHLLEIRLEELTENPFPIINQLADFLELRDKQTFLERVKEFLERKGSQGIHNHQLSEQDLLKAKKYFDNLSTK